MSLNVFSGPLPTYAYSVGLVRPAVVTSYGSQTEHRAARSSRTFRTFPYVWSGLTDAEKVALDSFFIGQSMTVTSFLWRDPSPDNVAEPFVRSGVSCGTSTLTQTVFSLPTGASEAAGDYPLSVGAVLKSNGTPVTVASVDTDARTITASVAPGASKTMTADYAFYRRVRLEAPYVWARGDSGLWSTSATFREVPS